MPAQKAHGAHPHRLSRIDASPARELSELSSATVSPEIPALPPAPALLMPPAMQAQAVRISVPAPPVAPPVATPIALAVKSVQPAKAGGRFNHVFATLLLWALIVAGAVLLVRLSLIRKPRPVQAAPLQEPAWTPDAIWHETRVEPLLNRLQTGAAPPVPGGGSVQASASKAAGPVGFTSSYSTAHAAVKPGPKPDPAPPAALSDYKNRCVAGLRHAGWDARTRFSAGQPGPDVIARSGGLVLALRCLASSEPVDVEAVEDACLVREQQRSDLAAIVSNASFTEAARQLAARTGIVLLHENELASFAA